MFPDESDELRPGEDDGHGRQVAFDDIRVVALVEQHDRHERDGPELEPVLWRQDVPAKAFLIVSHVSCNLDREMSGEK